ncbi:Hypothetical predicted protein, partial [Pelobates cultripes]
NVFAKYYESLYNLRNDKNTPQPQKPNITRFLDKINVPKLTPTQQTSLSAPITETEVLKAEKAPGPDGLPTAIINNSNKPWPHTPQTCSTKLYT